MALSAKYITTLGIAPAYVRLQPYVMAHHKDKGRIHRGDGTGYIE